jgi:6-phosphogluconolactonase (cycloisomerase 2 family)
LHIFRLFVLHGHFAVGTVVRILSGEKSIMRLISEYFRKNTLKLFSRLLKALIILTFTMYFTACAPGNGEPTYSVGGTVSGLSGSGLVLQNNGGDDLSVSSNGAFTFVSKLNSGKDYMVTIGTYPDNPLQTCTVINSSGTISNYNVTDIVVECKSIYTVGGKVSGLTGSGLVLKKNGADDLSISSNGSFTFETKLYDSTPYSVSIGAYPASPLQMCTLSNAGGTISGANVTNVDVECRNIYSVGGTVSGLTGSGLVLKKNGADDLSISSNGSFTFETMLYDLSAYSVTVGSQPSDQTCTISNAVGTTSGANVTNVAVQCRANTFSVGGTVSNLTGSGLVLQNNGGDNLSVSSNGTFTFPTEITDGSAYAITINTQPSGQRCTVSNPDGNISGAHVTNVTVQCVSPRFVYAVNNTSNTISQYNIGSNGTLSAMTPSTVAGFWNSNIIATDAAGKYAYMANMDVGANAIVQYTINTNGTLSAMSPFSVTAQKFPCFVAVDPTGKYAYVTNQGNNTVSQYTIGSNGSLSAMNPATVAAGTNPWAIAIDPLGRFAYVINTVGNTISQYSIGTDGHLSAIIAPVVSTGSTPCYIAIDPKGKYLYVVNYNNANISQYTIGSDGSLSAMSPTTIVTGSYPYSIVVDPTGKYAYAVSYLRDSIYQYYIGTDGKLSAMSPATVAAGSRSKYIAIDPTGRYAYVTNMTDNTISQYNIGTDGRLSAMSPATVATGTSPAGIVAIGW